MFQSKGLLLSSKWFNWFLKVSSCFNVKSTARTDRDETQVNEAQATSDSLITLMLSHKHNVMVWWHTITVCWKRIGGKKCNKLGFERLTDSWYVIYLRPSWMDSIKEWISLSMPELLTRASCRKDLTSISTESSLMSHRQPNRSRDWTELNWTAQLTSEGVSW